MQEDFFKEIYTKLKLKLYKCEYVHMSLRVELDKELERRFRELAMRRYGYSKGAIKKATELAIKKWSEDVVKEKSFTPRLL